MFKKMEKKLVENLYKITEKIKNSEDLIATKRNALSKILSEIDLDTNRMKSSEVLDNEIAKEQKWLSFYQFQYQVIVREIVESLLKSYKEDL